MPRSPLGRGGGKLRNFLDSRQVLGRMHPISRRRTGSCWWGLSLLIVIVASGAVPVTTTQASPRYRLARPPVVVYHYPSSGNVYFEISVRMNRALPRRGGRTIFAGARINGYGPRLDFGRQQESSGGFSSGGGNRPGRYCYDQSTINLIAPPPGRLARPKAGRRVHIQVFIKGRCTPLSAVVKLRRGGSGVRPAKVPGC